VTTFTPYLNEWGQPEPPLAGGEVETLLGGLERQRNTLAWKCRGLDAKAMNTTIAASAITIGGLLKHLASVEAIKFKYMFLGRSPGAPWDGIDWDADPGWPWTSAVDDAPDELMAMWQGAVADSRAIVAEALQGQGLDTSCAFTTPDGEQPNLRRLVIDLVEEYARHTGHADLIRESIDGLVGEDPPPGTPQP
jgi:hypothetical protein